MAEEVDNKAVVPFSEERLNSDEYRAWRKNAPFLYDMLYTAALEWPALSVTFLDHCTNAVGNTQHGFRLAMGTHTSGEEDEFLKVADFRCYNDTAPIDLKKFESHVDYRPPKEPLPPVPRLDVKTKIPHLTEVNRVVASLHDKFLLSTKINTGDVLLFKYTDYPFQPAKDKTCKPTLRLKGNTADGFSLTWNKLGHCASAGEDQVVCIWDVNQNPNAGSSTADESDPLAQTNYLNPTRSVKLTDGVIDDLVYSFHNHSILAAACDGGKLTLVDSRADSAIVSQTAMANNIGCTSAAFNPHNPHLLVTGGVDKIISLWDARYLKDGLRLHSMEGHADAVSRLHFAPFAEHILASGGEDGKVNLWDLSRIGAEQTAEEAEEGPPELLFVHGGHMQRITDFSWNPTPEGEWMIASASEDNSLMIWKPNEEIYLDPDYVQENIEIDSVEKKLAKKRKAME